MKIAVTSGAFDFHIHSIFAHKFKLPTSIINKIPDDTFDLYVFSGGADISPKIYKQDNTSSYGINLIRDKFELALLYRAIRHNKKIFGICRGHQLINAALGGSLHQSISNIYSNHGSQHELKKINDGIVPSCFDITNSLHHQAVKIPGKHLVVTSEHNGCIESTENNQIITTQFHPEIMADSGLFFTKLIEWASKPLDINIYNKVK